MLTHLSIKNLAIIDNINMEFSKGFNVLSGETGAGKSIIVDSVNLALGGRADRAMVRTGENSASVQAQFTIDDNDNLKELLLAYGIDYEEDIIVSRSISKTGKNSCRINGVISTLAQLKSITGYLVDIHGQHSHQSIMDPDTHVQIIDSFGGSKSKKLLLKLGSLYKEYNAKQRELDKLFGDDRLRAQRMDMLRYQLTEIRTAELRIGEDEELTNNRAIILNQERIKNALTGAYAGIYDGGDDDSAIDKLTLSQGDLNNISTEYDVVNSITERLETVLIELDDIAGEISKLSSDMEDIGESIDDIDDRIQLIKILKRKYGTTIEEILSYSDEIADEIQLMENSEVRIVELRKELEAIIADWQSTGQALYKHRYNLSKKLSKQIEEQLEQLGMGEAKFGVSFTPRNASKTLYTDGINDIEFIISTNRGEAMRSFFKIASGGEISRVMLALKSIIASADNIPTLIFDEIDTGIGGRMATVIGQKMANLGLSSQVICVTHSAPIAAMSDVHFFVSKHPSGNRTLTKVSQLSFDDKINEIGRMAGSDPNSQLGLDYAKELIIAGDEYKKGLQ